MKKGHRLLVFLIVISIGLFIPIDTMAKESLGTCNYSIDVDRLGLANLRILNLKVTVYDDGTTGNRKISGSARSGKRFNETPSSGLLLGDSGIYLQYSKMFDKNGKFYKKYKESNNCPNMQFIYYANANQLHFNVDGNRDAAGNPSIIATAESTGGSSSNTPSARTTYCNERRRPVRGSSSEMVFTTTEINGNKQYTITLGSQTLTGNYDSVITFSNGYIFRINPDDYDTYWSDSCQTSPLFLEASNGATNMIVQTTRPSDVNNGSYAADEAENDDGFDDTSWRRENAISSENWDKEIDCPDLFSNEPGSVGDILRTILGYIRVIGPILVVLLSAVDFIKAIFGFDEKAMSNAYRKLIIRLIAAIALFLIPTLIDLLLDFINATTCTLE